MHLSTGIRPQPEHPEEILAMFRRLHGARDQAPQSGNAQPEQPRERERNLEQGRRRNPDSPAWRAVVCLRAAGRPMNTAEILIALGLEGRCTRAALSAGIRHYVNRGEVAALRDDVGTVRYAWIPSEIQPEARP